MSCFVVALFLSGVFIVLSCLCCRCVVRVLRLLCRVVGVDCCCWFRLYGCGCCGVGVYSGCLLILVSHCFVSLLLWLCVCWCGCVIALFLYVCEWFVVFWFVLCFKVLLRRDIIVLPSDVCLFLFDFVLFVFGYVTNVFVAYFVVLLLLLFFLLCRVCLF